MMSAASNDLFRTASVGNWLFLITRTTSLGLGVAEAMYQGLVVVVVEKGSRREIMVY